jgi:GT2 family glycosyltransferase
MRVSVVVPARGRPEYLAEALSSIAAQTRAADEVIVSEDGAEPEIAAVITRAPLPVTHIANRAPLGQLGNRRQAFAAATGELVAMLDDDDRWSPDFLATMEAALIEHPDCAFASADHWWMSARGEIMERESDVASERFGRATMVDGVYDDVLARTLTTQPFALQFTLFRRKALAAVGFFPQTAGTAPDFALMLTLGARGERAVYVNRRLGAYRVHAAQQTRTGRIENATAVIASLRAVAPSCDAQARGLLARRYRQASLEGAIAHAHKHSRTDALAALAHAWALGPGPLSARRLIVLAVLLATPKRRASVE